VKTSLIVTLLLCILIIVTGCPRPSSAISRVRPPNAITDKSENTYVVYQNNEGNKRTTYIQRLGYYGDIVWKGKGIELYSEPGSNEAEVSALLENSKYGQTIIVWEDTQGIHSEKIDSSGLFRWNNEISIAAKSTYGLKTAGDSAGGVIIGWSDENSNLYLQRVDFDGNIAWKTGSPLCNTQYFNLETDDSGNIFVTWEDKDSDTYIQKLDSTGKPCWVPGGILVSDLYGSGDRMNSIISDGSGGAIIAWIHAIRSEDNSSVTGNGLYAQRFSAEGAALWETDGVPIHSMSQEQPISAPLLPQLVSDNAGGAFVIWRDIMSIYAQRINAPGETLWSQGGIEVWDGEGAPRSPFFSTVSDDSGGFILVWNYI